MRCLERNKRVFHYAAYAGQEEIVDEYGNATGQFKITYDSPKEMSGNISAAQGEVQNRQFGDSETYDKVIVLDCPDCLIDEYSILWIDKSPELDENGVLALDENGEVVTPHDYIVKKVARSLNSVSIAVSKVVVQ